MTAVTTLALFVWTGLQAQEPHVLDLQQEVQALSSELSITITVSPALAKNLIYIERRGAPALEVLHLVARSVHATILQDGTGLRVERTHQDVDALRARRTAERVAWLEQTLKRRQTYRISKWNPRDPQKGFLDELDQFSGQLASYFGGKSSKTPLDFPGEMTPSSTLLDGLCRRIGPESLASLPSGDVLVFEEQPVAGAKPLPSHADLLGQYETAMAGLGPLHVSQKLKSLINSSGNFEAESIKEWDRSSHSISRLRIQVRGNESMMNIMLEGYDQRGDRVFQNGMVAAANGQLRSSKALLQDDSGTGVPHSPADIIQLPVDHLEALRSSTVGSKGGLPNWLQHPENVEPLDLFVRDALSAVASGFSKPFVACVPDSFWGQVARSVKEGSLHLNVFRENVSEYNPFELIDEPTGVVWRPIDAEAVERRRADRKVLGRFARRAQATSSVGVREIALLYHDASERIGDLTQTWAARVCHGYSSDLENPLNLPEDWLAMLGAINDSDWEALLAGQASTIGRLGIQREFQQVIDNGQANPPVMADQPFPDIFQHPTELFPSGSTEDTPFSAILAAHPTMRYWFEGGDELGTWYPSSQLNHISNMVQPSEVEWEGDTPTVKTARSEYDKRIDRLLWRNGTESNLVCTCSLPAGLILRVSHLAARTQDSELNSFKALSPDERNALWIRAVAAASTEARNQRSAAAASHVASNSQPSVINPPPR